MIDKEAWFRLPMQVRLRYWRETDYGKLPMSEELRQAIDEAPCRWCGMAHKDACAKQK